VTNVPRPAPLIEILLVEDNPGDIRLMREALRESKIVRRIHSVTDGQKAIDFLRKPNNDPDAVRPDIIFLDLNLPRKDGREVLAEIKADSKLRRIPVVILTSSQAEEDILRSYDNHANCYVTKPVDLEKFMEVVHTIENFWGGTVERPPE
jgi:CheY-like chemotaxis protein